MFSDFLRAQLGPCSIHNRAEGQETCAEELHGQGTGAHMRLRSVEEMQGQLV